ncbi:MAG: type I restriction endonuclease subunit R, partial [Candidatus Muirbacterium halophilum]|nr:type I restriction endonuclease subunit R [Candidatus Muirbacterium halophilum]
ISSFDHKAGVVETIGSNKTSQDLLKAINDGKKIIVTTIQKFPIIYQEVEKNTGNKFAIIVDEAHSSQTGTSAQKMKEALADTEQALKEFEKFDIREEENRKDFEDKLIEEIIAHGKHKNLSFFAFTATPKERTLEIFGQIQYDGTFKPFHIYSMRQAIEEGFILDVLANYTTYKTYYKIGKNIPDNPELPASETREAITRYESLHAYNLQQKTAVIIEHFRANTKHKIKGKAKAMIVTSSRLHAVRYYHEFKKYIKAKNYEDLDILIAFSGTVKDGGEEYTESGMNKTKNGNRVSESQLPEVFHSDEFNMLIVAEKYQTGFDEPLLHTMFVDKRLCGVKAVQTLSRLNRICKNKEDTYVLDFVNRANEIKEAFEPYYEQTSLDEEVNVNMIYDIKNTIKSYQIYNSDDVDKVNKFLTEAKQKEKQTDKMLGKFTSYYKPVVKSYEETLNDEQKYEFKKSVKNFIKWYSYITQIVRLFDIELHKEYNFLYSLSKLLPNKEKEKVSIDDKVKLEYYKIAETFTGSISLAEEKGELENTKTASNTGKKEEKRELLDIIIDNINARTEGDFTEEDKVILKTMMDEMGKNINLESFAKNNDLEMYRKSIFPDVFGKIAHQCYTNQMEAFKKLFQNKEFYHVIMDELANQTYNQYRNK